MTVRPAPSSSLDDYVRSIVDGFPPMTDDQRNRIATLLRPDALSAPTPQARPVVIPAPRRAAA